MRKTAVGGTGVKLTLLLSCKRVYWGVGGYIIGKHIYHSYTFTFLLLSLSVSCERLQCIFITYIYTFTFTFMRKTGNWGGLGLHNWQEVPRPCAGRSQVNPAGMTMNMMVMMIMWKTFPTLLYLDRPIPKTLQISREPIRCFMCPPRPWPWSPQSVSANVGKPMGWLTTFGGWCHNKYSGEAISDQGSEKSAHKTGRYQAQWAVEVCPSWPVGFWPLILIW